MEEGSPTVMDNGWTHYMNHSEHRQRHWSKHTAQQPLPYLIFVSVSFGFPTIKAHPHPELAEVDVTHDWKGKKPPLPK